MNPFNTIRDDTGIELDQDFAQAYEHELRGWYDGIHRPRPGQQIAIAQCANKYHTLTRSRLRIVAQVWSRLRNEYEMNQYSTLHLAC